MLALVLSGCASSQPDPAEEKRAFDAGLAEAFAMLQESGIEIVRIVGPFERPVVQWRPDMTLAQVILAAGYLDTRDPAQIFILRQGTAIPVDPSELLNGQDTPVESGDVVHVLP
jgi:hypothetical protein